MTNKMVLKAKFVKRERGYRKTLLDGKMKKILAKCILKFRMHFSFHAEPFSLCDIVKDKDFF